MRLPLFFALALAATSVIAQERSPKPNPNDLWEYIPESKVLLYGPPGADEALASARCGKRGEIDMVFLLENRPLPAERITELSDRLDMVAMQFFVGEREASFAGTARPKLTRGHQKTGWEIVIQVVNTDEIWDHFIDVLSSGRTLETSGAHDGSFRNRLSLKGAAEGFKQLRSACPKPGSRTKSRRAS